MQLECIRSDYLFLNGSNGFIDIDKTLMNVDTNIYNIGCLINELAVLVHVGEISISNAVILVERIVSSENFKNKLKRGCSIYNLLDILSVNQIDDECNIYYNYFLSAYALSPHHEDIGNVILTKNKYYVEDIMIIIKDIVLQSKLFSKDDLEYLYSQYCRPSDDVKHYCFKNVMKNILVENYCDIDR